MASRSSNQAITARVGLVDEARWRLDVLPLVPRSPEDGYARLERYLRQTLRRGRLDRFEELAEMDSLLGHTLDPRNAQQWTLVATVLYHSVRKPFSEERFGTHTITSVGEITLGAGWDVAQRALGALFPEATKNGSWVTGVERFPTAPLAALGAHGSAWVPSHRIPDGLQDLEGVSAKAVGDIPGSAFAGAYKAESFEDVRLEATSVLEQLRKAYQVAADEELALVMLLG